MVVQHNISAMNANRYYGINNKALAGSLEKLSSGYAINRAGDNAAGLAVSEKMRAQIGGLTQASKNAEDGISMVQTFEGALQETDSILQRMRTLAVQSANGSYSDDVDRDAIQLEFDQLNDELNQIADTDFNGTVMLNGGTMADGVHAVGGTIDYANKKAQVTDAGRKALQTQLENATGAYTVAKKTYEDGKYDLSSKGDAPEWNTVDNSVYCKDVADDLWGTMGYTKTVGSNQVADTSQADTISITFKYNESSNSWTADSAVSSLNGQTVETFGASDLTGKFEVENSAMGASTNASGDGGFNVKLAAASGVKQQDGSTDLDTDGTTDNALGNAIFDSSNVTDGSTVTLTFKNGDATAKAPDNAGWNESSITQSLDSGASEVENPTIALDANLKDSAMTQDVEDALTALEDAKVSLKYDADANFAAGDITINGTKIAIGAAADTTPTAVTNSDGKSFYASSTEAGEITLYADKAKSVTIGTISAGADEAATESGGKTTDATSGTWSGKISISEHAYSANSSVNLTAGDDPKLESSDKYKAKMDAAFDKMSAAAEKLKDFDNLDQDNAQDWEKIKTIYAEAMTASGNKVSVSDNFDNSTATLTYTNSMDLQVGARSKDIVQFTMGYSSKGLGDLESNLNCSSREGGLETAKLSLRTSESANAAIDKIDNAINKVNMVRATFGAVQNRLEHKINTLDTNNENLTAAESRIRDTQMDKEMMKFTSSQILSQASQSMLAQANSLPQGVLQLLG